MADASSYTAEDALQRKATVAQVRDLAWPSTGGARASATSNCTMLMIDDRKPEGLGTSALNNSSSSSSSSRSMAGIPYYHKAMVLNYLYAQRHGYGFRIVKPTPGDWLHPSTRAATMRSGDDGGGLCPAWCRVKILAALVLELLAPGHAGRLPASSPTTSATSDHWILFLDSDAYVREQSTDLLVQMGHPLNSNVHFAIAREELPAGGFRSPRRRPHGVRTPSMNAGVLLVRASDFSAGVLAAWMHAPSTPICAPFRQSWPCEQQCFHELLRNRTLLPPGWRERIATAPMQLFNSPWGSYIRHIWGGPGAALRKTAFDDELKVQGVWKRRHFTRLLQQAASTWVDVPC